MTLKIAGRGSDLIIENEVCFLDISLVFHLSSFNLQNHQRALRYMQDSVCLKVFGLLLDSFVLAVLLFHPGAISDNVSTIVPDLLQSFYSHCSGNWP